MTEGLTTEEAQKRLAHYGPNVLPEPKLPGPAVIFLRQFLSPLIYILLAAAVVSLFAGEHIDAIFIFAVLLINAAIGTVQEYSAQREAAALKKMVPSSAAVKRDGVLQRIEARDVVPGDLVYLETGDKVPADIKLSGTRGLHVDESLLTGESVPVVKDHKKTSDADTPLGDRLDAVFAGTNVVRGRAHGEVTATAMETELGRIAKAATAGKTVKPPLLLRIERFTLRISLAMLALIAVLFAVSIYRDGDLTEVFLLAVALAVAAIPEGLPAAITVTLAIGMRRMAACNVIVRKLLAVESLGSCTFIASDKTGTLTVNELTIRRIVTPDGGICRVTGEGFSPEGGIEAESGDAKDAENARELVLAGVLANEAHPGVADDSYEGDTVDLAFIALGRKIGIDRKTVLRECPETGTIPYESEAGFSASVCALPDRRRIYVKGSTERLLGMCAEMMVGDTKKPIDADAIQQQTLHLAEQGYRVLALAEGDTAADKPEEGLRGLVFLGLVGMIDPLRPEAADAVAQCRKAGIEVAMITGDHPETARTIAAEIGMTENFAEVVTGANIRALAKDNDVRLDETVANSRVFARIEPAQKQQIVKSLIRQGHFVAVTGDGVNDVPALGSAHVGVAMGKRGTDVARESAELILTDDNFASIVNGIREGRIVYQNIRKVILLLVTAGIAEIILFLMTLLTGLPMPLVAVQLLWLNLVTNGVQDVAMAFEPAEGGELDRPPRRPDEPIFNRLMIERVLFTSVIVAVVAFAVFAWALGRDMGVEAARNVTLLLMVLFVNVHALNSRSETVSIFRQNFFSNPLLLGSIVLAHALHIGAMYVPGLSHVLEIEPVSLEIWTAMLGLSLTLIAAEEAQKFVLRRRIRRDKP